MNIFLLYFVLLMILLIRSARSMSFDLPFYGYDSYMDTYLDNTNDEISEDGQRNQNANEQVTIEPQPLLLYSTTSPYKSNPSYENADCGRDENDCCDSNNTRKKATYIAQNAAQVAKAANEAQAAAAEDASRRVKMQLADKAICAARAANAVLAGKKIVVDNYAREIGEAESVVDQVSISLERSEENAEAACSAAKTAENETNSFRSFFYMHSESIFLDNPFSQGPGGADTRYFI
ncbi:uncharacterized protein LOC108117106 isoform X2 [Drosophila eugracilis]|uniref:uncharacterized protein LOC108117106 isoform X2 n=1 Tax=Drosophila eugracilis TaxID=29029 RepID=UPI0007E6413B|nr:uncharacterized protein LOC108117106 isoform X2 [Drosophila eugracilis]